MDFVARQPQVRQDALVFVTDGSPKEILEIVPPLEFTSSENIYKMVKLERTDDVTVMRVLKEMNGDAKTTVIPVLMKIGEKTLGLDGVALFKGDRMVEHLHRKAKEGLMWIQGEFSSGTVTAPNQGEKGDVALEVTKEDTRADSPDRGKKTAQILRKTLPRMKWFTTEPNGL